MRFNLHRLYLFLSLLLTFFVPFYIFLWLLLIILTEYQIRSRKKTYIPLELNVILIKILSCSSFDSHVSNAFIKFYNIWKPLKHYSTKHEDNYIPTCQVWKNISSWNVYVYKGLHFMLSLISMSCQEQCACDTVLCLNILTFALYF